MDAMNELPLGERAARARKKVESVLLEVWRGYNRQIPHESNGCTIEFVPQREVFRVSWMGGRITVYGLCAASFELRDKLDSVLSEAETLQPADPVYLSLRKILGRKAVTSA